MQIENRNVIPEFLDEIHVSEMQKKKHLTKLIITKSRNMPRNFGKGRQGAGAPSTNPQLWKDIWWMKYLILVVFCSAFYLCLKVIKRIILPILKIIFLNDPPRRGQQNRIDDEDKMKTGKWEDEDFAEFQDLTDHGIPFYENRLEKGRKRHPRMCCTVTASAVKKYKLSGPTMIAPPFPTLDEEEEEPEEEMDRGDKFGKELYNSCDARCDAATDKKNWSPLSEEEALHSSDELDTIMHNFGKCNSDVNVDADLTPKPSHLVLHQYPRTATGPVATSAFSVETCLRRLNVSFTLEHDCDGSTGPYLVDEGIRIDGAANCMKYIKEKFPDEYEFKYEDPPSKITVGPYYPMTVVDDKNPVNDLYCSICRNKEEHMELCAACLEYRNILMNPWKEYPTRENDHYIDDEFADMMDLVDVNVT